MIISYRHQLLFLKTPKTASSSIEAWLAEEIFGGRESSFRESEEHEPFADERGIATRMGNGKAGDSEIKPHISLTDTRTLLGKQSFRALTTVTTVRNPFDQIVSLFWWRTARLRPELYSDLLGAPLKVVAKAFQEFVGKVPRNPWFRQRNWLVSEDREDEAQRVMRFEKLEEDFEAVRHDFFGATQTAGLPAFKSTLRRVDIEYRSLFNLSTRYSVGKMMDWECQRFSYKF